MELSYGQAINLAIEKEMERDPSVVLIGQGVPDGIFGSTAGLCDKFQTRVFDSPLSENGVTGICIGAALNHMKPIMTHQRMDFSLLSFDQLINNAAKWASMFGGKSLVPLTVRMVIGRGWGQGPQHSQALHSMLASVPGLVVYVPQSPQDAYSMTRRAIYSDLPTILVEHRWLYDLIGKVEIEDYDSFSCNKYIVKTPMPELTMVSLSYGTVEAKKAVEYLQSNLVEQDIEVDLINIGRINPLDTDTIEDSVNMSGRLLVIDIGNRSCGIGSEIISRIAEKNFKKLRSAPKLLSNKPYPQPTSHFLTKDYYVSYKDTYTGVF